MIVLGLDPGRTCGIVQYNTFNETIRHAGEGSGDGAICHAKCHENDVVVIEDFLPQMVPCGHDVIATCKLIGRLQAECEHSGRRCVLLSREQVLDEICPDFRLIESAWRRAKKEAKARDESASVPKPNRDKLVRMALVLKFGGDKAIGFKKEQGPLYEFKGRPHCFSALGLCLAFVAREARGET